MSVDYRVSGDVDVSRRLKAIIDALSRDELQNAMLPGARIVRAEAARKSPSTRVALALRIKKSRRSRNPTVSVSVGYQAASLAYWLEKGTRPRVQKKTGRYTGFVYRRPFLRPALDKTRPQVIESFGRAVRRRILKAARSG